MDDHGAAPGDGSPEELTPEGLGDEDKKGPSEAEPVPSDDDPFLSLGNLDRPTTPRYGRRVVQRSLHEWEDRLPPLPTRQQRIMYALWEQRLSFLAGAATGAGSVALKFALAGIVTTMPVVAIGAGAVFGGAAGYIRHSARAGKWEWDTRAVLLGAASGAIGGGLGGALGNEVIRHFFAHPAVLSVARKAVKAAKVVKALPVPKGPDVAALAKLINSDNAFKGHEALRKAALRYLAKRDFRHVAARLADAAYLQHAKLHHYTKGMYNLWQQASNLVNSQDGPTARRIIKGAAWLARNPQLLHG